MSSYSPLSGRSSVAWADTHSLMSAQTISGVGSRSLMVADLSLHSKFTYGN
ncbi:MAG: hypothetical protein J07HQX50_00188 [Haloquadratum sp. J07HQX50]|nr:MAG: hypothetical protein J07HQX50_00188 [Haloquadratum sp. J07HQX50]